MPKKGSKKGASGKSSGMTEEERILYLHQRAEAEKDIARRKEEMLTQFLKDKLQKEEKNSSVNFLKLTQQWRVVLRQARGTELCREVDIVSQTFERVLDCKNSIIKGLVEDLSEAEQQVGLALRSQLQFVDRLLALQASRLEFFLRQRDIDLQSLIAEFSTEREIISSLQDRNGTHLKDVTAATDQRHSMLAEEAQLDYQSRRDEIKTKYLSEKQSLKIQMDDLMKQVCEGPAATEDHGPAFNQLFTSHQRRQQEIETQRKKQQKMQESISALRKHDSTQQKRKAAAQELREAQEEVHRQTRQLEARVGRARAAGRKRLTALTVHSTAAAKTLQGIISKGERMLRRAELCRRFESDHEKVLPFYPCSLSPEEQSLVERNTGERPSEELAGAMLDYAGMERFMQRYNRVLLERLCLSREKRALTQENQQLQALLRRYMDGISVNDEVIRRRNNLLLTVSRPPLTSAPGTDRRRNAVPVTEAAYVVQSAL